MCLIERNAEAVHGGNIAVAQSMLHAQPQRRWSTAARTTVMIHLDILTC